MERARVRVASVKYHRDPFVKRTVDQPGNSYQGRPCISETVAGLVEREALRPDDVVIDIGCGGGIDLITLANWGFRDLHGLDYNAADIRTAKGRERRLLRKPRIKWKVGTAWHLREYGEASLDVALDTLTICNFGARHHARYFNAVARLIRPGGRFVVQYRDYRPVRPPPRAPVSLFKTEAHAPVAFGEGRFGMERRGAGGVYVLRRTREPARPDAAFRR